MPLLLQIETFLEEETLKARREPEVQTLKDEDLFVLDKVQLDSGCAVGCSLCSLVCLMWPGNRKVLRTTGTQLMAVTRGVNTVASVTTILASHLLQHLMTATVCCAPSQHSVADIDCHAAWQSADRLGSTQRFIQSIRTSSGLIMLSTAPAVYCCQAADDSAVPAAIRKRRRDPKPLKSQLILDSLRDGITPVAAGTKKKQKGPAKPLPSSTAVAAAVVVPAAAVPAKKKQRRQKPGECEQQQ